MVLDPSETWVRRGVDESVETAEQLMWDRLVRARHRPGWSGHRTRGSALPVVGTRLPKRAVILAKAASLNDGRLVLGLLTKPAPNWWPSRSMASRPLPTWEGAVERLLDGGRPAEPVTLWLPRSSM
jgi:hypothetical protein